MYVLHLGKRFAKCGSWTVTNDLKYEDLVDQTYWIRISGVKSWQEESVLTHPPVLLMLDPLV